MNGKSLIQSREFWWNLTMGALQVADWAAGTGLIPQPYGVAVQSIVAILLRTFFTKEPITGILTPAKLGALLFAALLGAALTAEARQFKATAQTALYGGTLVSTVTPGQEFYIVGCGYAAERAGWAGDMDASWDTVLYTFDVEDDGCIQWYDSSTFVAPGPGSYTVDLCQYFQSTPTARCRPMGQATVTVVP